MLNCSVYVPDYGESRERFAETLEILKRAWTEPSFSCKGKYYSFENVKLTPKPYQKPWPEIRVAANSADTFPAIAKLGQALAAKVRLIVWCKGCQHQAEPDVADQVARYGADTAVIDWARRLRCSACEGGKVDSVVSGAAR